MSKVILRWPAVVAKVKICKVSIQAQINAGTFPKPIQLGDGRAVGFIESEIDSWIDFKIAERDAQGGL